MKAYKNGADLTFVRDDGVIVKYNLDTKECIGKYGKNYKHLKPQLKEYTVKQIADSFEDRNFGKFIEYVSKRASDAGTELINIDTILQRLDRFKNEEEIFSVGLALDSWCTKHSRWDDKDYKGTLNDIPENLVKILKKINEPVGDSIVKEYKLHPDIFDYAGNHRFITISNKTAVYQLLIKTRSYDCADTQYLGESLFFYICNKFNIFWKSLLNYIDYLETYEGYGDNSCMGCEYILSDINQNLELLSEMNVVYEKFPKNFASFRNITSKIYNYWFGLCPENIPSQKSFDRCVKPKMETTIESYRFIYPKTISELKQESVTQSNCIATNIDRVINGECDIILMRDKNDIDNSLVTVEVRGGKVVQARQRFNESVTENQQKALDKYEEFLSHIGSDKNE